jgi:hypothetical protein
MGNKKFRFPITTLAGTTTGNFISVCRKHFISPLFYHKITLSFLLAAFLEPFALWEKAFLNKRLKTIRIEEHPVFIIGFWRSGTTLLHELLCLDPSAAYTKTFQIVFPHLALLEPWWLKKLGNMGLPEKRPFDETPWHMDSPQEDEFAMLNLQEYGLYNFFLFPGEWDRILRQEFQTAKLPPASLEKWKASYLHLLKKAMVITGGRRYISKNPCHLGRLDLLRSIFPEARFIFIYRNPYQVIESTYQFFQSVFPGVRLQNLKPGFSRKEIVDLYSASIRNYFSFRGSVPAGSLIELRMEDFVNDVTGQMDRIYDTFGMGPFKKVRADVENCIKVNSHQSKRSYEIPPETYELVNKFASDIVQGLGYEMQNPF